MAKVYNIYGKEQFDEKIVSVRKDTKNQEIIFKTEKGTIFKEQVSNKDLNYVDKEKKFIVGKTYNDVLDKYNYRDTEKRNSPNSQLYFDKNEREQNKEFSKKYIQNLENAEYRKKFRIDEEEAKEKIEWNKYNLK